MKTLVLTFALFLAGFGLMAQDNTTTATAPAKPMQTLLNNTSNIGFMVGLTNGFSVIDNRDAYVGGLTLGLVFDHSLTVGFAGRGFGCASAYTNIVAGKEAYLTGGYGGLYFEPIITPSEVVHITLPIIIGAGGAGYVEHRDWQYDNDDDEWDNHSHNNITLASDEFFVLEPGVQVEMNVVKWMRLGVGASYRWVYGLDLKNTNANTLDGFTTNMTFKFGKF